MNKINLRIKTDHIEMIRKSLASEEILGMKVKTLSKDRSLKRKISISDFTKEFEIELFSAEEKVGRIIKNIIRMVRRSNSSSLRVIVKSIEPVLAF